MEVGYAERLVDGQFNNAIEGCFCDCYATRAGRQDWQSFHWRAFRYVKLRFRSCGAPVRVHAVRARCTRYPFEERGRFTSSDDVLNGAYAISRATLRLCSHEFIVDTPWREAAQWTGDVSAVTLPGILSCFGDTVLPSKYFRQSAANMLPNGLLSNVTNAVPDPLGRVIPDYSLWWVRALWQHFLYTGDAVWLDRMYPQVLRILQFFADCIDEHGLAGDVPLWVFVDWADVDKRGECAAVNALLYGTLVDIRAMAERRGDRATVSCAESIRAGIGRAFGERLWDAGRGLYADANVDGRLSEKVSEHGNMAAIRFGLCDAERAARMIRVLYEERSARVTEAQPFFTSVVLQGLALAGRFDLALGLVRERWGERMLARGATSTYEEWGINGSWRAGRYKGFMRTLSHAWSAAPADFLVRWLAGIEILEPGCAALRVVPHAADIDYEVVFPTPRGGVRVTCRGGVVAVAAPEGMRIAREPRDAGV